jgi:citrate lyase subunit beta / citryl-CoA lyase
VAEPRTSGGIELELVSYVDSCYGEAIRKQVRGALCELGVQHARILIEDGGALPFVIVARIEAAIRRAGLYSERSVLPRRLELPAPSLKDRLRRTRLYLPGNEPKYFVNAALYRPDGVILDLEDSVHPAEKEAARILVRNGLRAVDFGRSERMVRINKTPLGLEDLEEIIPQAPDLILLPKTEDAREVTAIDQLITEIAQREGIDRPIWIMPILESAMGIENAFSIATSSDRICALSIGLEDYTSDLGVTKTPGGQETLFARMRMLNAARAAGVQAIDSVYADIDDLEGLARWGEQSRALGFEGMGCVHPAQIPVVERAYTPLGSEVEKALRIVSAFDEAQSEGLGVVRIDSKMIDAPVVTRARRLVERGRMLGLLPPAGPDSPGSKSGISAEESGNRKAKP